MCSLDGSVILFRAMRTRVVVPYVAAILIRVNQHILPVVSDHDGRLVPAQSAIDPGVAASVIHQVRVILHQSSRDVSPVATWGNVSIAFLHQSVVGGDQMPG